MICKDKPVRRQQKHIEIPIDGVIERYRAKKRTMLDIPRECRQLSELVKKPPKEEESFRMISAGGFSLIAFIDYIAEREGINEMSVSTLTVGKKHMEYIDKLHKAGKLDKAFFVFCSIFKQSNSKGYGYFDRFQEICNKNSWHYCQSRNHSKILLMRTADNWYVVETSSNLNENPKIEQFTFENDKKLYGFYYKFFESLKGVAWIDSLS